MEKVECLIHDARPNSAEFALETSGFTLVRRPSGVRDWFDNDEVMRVYYDECKELARELTGASHAFTFDHLIREPGRQTGGGGLLKKHEVTTAERGGGYVSVVHMDYTDNSTWGEYLSLYGFSEPHGASGVVGEATRRLGPVPKPAAQNLEPQPEARPSLEREPGPKSVA